MLRILIICVVMVILWTGCLGITPIPILSDVPCVTPEWEGDVVTIGFRTELPTGGRLLFTAQTLDQSMDDARDNGTKDYFPHLDVYSIDPDNGTLLLSEPENWNHAEGLIGNFQGSEANGFGIGASESLEYQGETVDIMGRKVWRIIGDPKNAGVAVLSHHGGQRYGFGLFNNRAAYGQFFHQTYSTETGQPTGPLLKLGFGDGLAYITPTGQWTHDRRYVIYRSGREICIAPSDVE